EDFAPIARIEAIWLFLAYALFKDFVIYQMDVKSDFLYGQIKKEVYVCQPLGFEDPEFPDKVYKLERHYMVYIKLLEPGLQVTQKKEGIFISQDKYVDEILKKFGFPTVMTASTPMETSKPLMKDENAEDVDVYLYRSMIGPFIYLTSSRPDIMFVERKRFFRDSYTIVSIYAGITSSGGKAKIKVIEIPLPSDPTNLDADEAIYEEKGDRFGAGGRPKLQETIGDRTTQTRFERLSKQFNDPLFLRVNTLRSGEDNMKLKELMKLYTKLSARGKNDFDDESFDADMNDVFEDVKGDAEQVISAATDEASTGDAVNIVGTKVNTASASVTTAGISISTAEPNTPPITT
nr:hypothetical protein [Tanacetum cinerariifolium]